MGNLCFRERGHGEGARVLLNGDFAVWGQRACGRSKDVVDFANI